MKIEFGLNLFKINGRIATQGNYLGSTLLFLESHVSFYSLLRLSLNFPPSTLLCLLRTIS